MKSIDPDYEPDPEVLAKFPDISGNTVNGFGEPEKRAPNPFFWHPPDCQTHGELREFVMDRFVASRDGGRNWGDVGDRGPELVEKSPLQEDRPPEEWSELIHKTALDHEADICGFTAMDPLWIYQGYEISEPTLVVLGFAQDYEMMKHAPPRPGNHYSNTEVRKQYNRGARASKQLANKIRQLGFNATPHHGPDAEALLMIPAAIAAGLGELGKHGSIINRRYGSNFRLAAVSTDMPLTPHGKDEFGADEFCINCQVCANACPPGAITETKHLVRGETKWYVDFDKCIPYFAEHLGCALCMVVCPWSRPGIADNLLAKLARREG
jgi:epoxyqueuosine reductase